MVHLIVGIIDNMAYDVARSREFLLVSEYPLAYTISGTSHRTSGLIVSKTTVNQEKNGFDHL